MKSTQKFKTPKTHGFLVGLVGGVLSFTVLIIIIRVVLLPEEHTLKMLFYAPLIFLGFLYLYFLSGSVYCCYELTNKSVMLNHGPEHVNIPYQDVKQIQILQGKPVYYPIVGMSWPGHMMGLYLLMGVGAVRLYAAKLDNGSVLLRTKLANFIIMPEKLEMLEILSTASGVPVEILDLDELSGDFHTYNLYNDLAVKALKFVNLVGLMIFLGFLLVYLPENLNCKKLVLLLVLDVLLMWANFSNTKRLYPYSRLAAILMQVISLLFTAIFVLISVWKLHV